MNNEKEIKPLLPCPFCGNVPYTEFNWDYQYHQISCLKATKCEVLPKVRHHNYDTVVKIWNTRFPEEQHAKKSERLLCPVCNSDHPNYWCPVKPSPSKSEECDGSFCRICGPMKCICKPSPSSEPSECENRLQCIYCAGTGTLGNKGCHYCKGTGKEHLVDGKEVSELQILSNRLQKLKDKGYYNPDEIATCLISEGYSKKENAKELVGLDENEVLKCLENVEVEYLPEHEGYQNIDWNATDLNTAKAICSRFGQRTVELPSVEEIYAIINSYKMFDKFTVNGISQRIHSAMQEKISREQ